MGGGSNNWRDSTKSWTIAASTVCKSISDSRNSRSGRLHTLVESLIKVAKSRLCTCVPFGQNISESGQTRRCRHFTRPQRDNNAIEIPAEIHHPISHRLVAQLNGRRPLAGQRLDFGLSSSLSCLRRFLDPQDQAQGDSKLLSSLLSCHRICIDLSCRGFSV